MTPEETHDYAEGWDDMRRFIGECDDEELMYLFEANYEQAAAEQPTNQYFWGGFQYIEEMMYARGLMGKTD